MWDVNKYVLSTYINIYDVQILISYWNASVLQYLERYYDILTNHDHKPKREASNQVDCQQTSLKTNSKIQSLLVSTPQFVYVWLMCSHDFR